MGRKELFVRMGRDLELQRRKVNWATVEVEKPSGCKLL